MNQRQILINAALEKFSGDRELAALALGKTRHEIDLSISHNKELKFRWAKGPGGKPLGHPPSQSETLHRPPAPAPNGNIAEHEKNLVTAMIREDALLAEGVERLGLSPEEATRAAGMAEFGKVHLVDTVHMITSCMTAICLKLGTTQMDATTDRLASVRAEIAKCLSPIARSELVKEEKFLMDSLLGLAEQVKKMTDTTHRGLMLQSMIRFKLGGGRATKEKSLKPGFSAAIPIDSSSSNE